MPITAASDLTNIVAILSKGLVLVGFGVYIVFALVVIQQAILMNRTVKIGMEIPIYLIVFSHALFAVGVFILALIIL